MTFLGSWAGDSLLVRYNPERADRAVAITLPGSSNASSSSSKDAPAAKRRRLSRLASMDMGGGEEGGNHDEGAGSDGEEAELFKSATGTAASDVMPTVSRDAVKYRLKVSNKGHVRCGP